VAKAAGERHGVPFVHRLTGEIGPGMWRTWVASRRWGASMRSVLQAQRLHRRDADPEGRRAAGAGAAGALDPNCASYAASDVVPTLAGAAAV